MRSVTENGTAVRSAEEWVGEFIEGWRAPKSPDAFADHFDAVLTDDVRMIQPQLPTMVGKTAFREGFVRPTFALIPDLHATVHDWAVRRSEAKPRRAAVEAPDSDEAGDVVFINFTLAGTLGGKPLSWPCIDRIVLRDGLACERRAYFDPTPLLRAVLTRPRAWPGFARIQAGRLAGALRQGGKR
jgi:ketosteroid isomerase-like protein